MGGLVLFVLMGVWIAVGKETHTRRGVERRPKVGEPYYQPREIEDILTKIGAEIEAKTTRRLR
jgi:hypothetical protein